MNLEERIKSLEEKYSVLQQQYEKIVFGLHHVHRSTIATLEGLYNLEKRNGTKFKFEEHWEKTLQKANSDLKGFTEEVVIR